METFTKLDDRQDLLDSITILEKELPRPAKMLPWLLTAL